MAKKILVIDDEELVTKSLLKLLNREGYEAVVVSSGQDALKQVKTNDFDLIISDVRMPEMDGIETIRRIRVYLEEAKKNPIPEVLISGYADVDKYENAMNLEVADYLYKPFDNKEFLRIVQKNLKDN